MKADELWEKYWDTQEMLGDKVIGKDSFLAALAEYGQAVRDRDAEICKEQGVAPCAGNLYATTSNDTADDCAAAISREPLP